MAGHRAAGKRPLEALEPDRIAGRGIRQVDHEAGQHQLADIEAGDVAPFAPADIGRIEIGADRGLEAHLGQLELRLAAIVGTRLVVADERPDAGGAFDRPAIGAAHAEARHAILEDVAEIDEARHGSEGGFPTGGALTGP